MAKKWVPVEPVNKEMFIKYQVSLDPKDIPKVKLSKSILLIKMDELEKAKEDAAKLAMKSVEDTKTTKV